MKKAFIIAMLVVVSAIVGFFVYSELTVKELFYVSNLDRDDEKGSYYVQRLYSSDVDMEAYNQRLEKLISLEFTDEEIMQAALEAGTPEICPTVHVITYRPSLNENEVLLELGIGQELAPGQDTAEFSLSDIHLEVMTDGIQMKDVSAKCTDSFDTQTDASIIRNDAGTAFSTDLGDYGVASLVFDGTNGSVTIQCSYGIKKNSLIKHMAMEDCFIMINVNFSEQELGRIKVTYSCDPATTLDEYNEQ